MFTRFARLLVVLLAAGLMVVPVEAQTLAGFASLPADTFAPGPTSGQLIPPPFPINGRTPPFEFHGNVSRLSQCHHAGGLPLRNDSGKT
jgi:hypothetical protein